jgi:hypothetical protein
MSEFTSGVGLSGQPDPNELVKRMLTSVVQHADQIPREQAGEVERAMVPVHQAYLEASGLTERELRRERGSFATEEEPSGSRLSQETLQQAHDVLYLIEVKDTTQFQQVSITAIQQIQPMLKAARQQVPAQAEQFISAQAGGQQSWPQGKQRRPGSAP